MKRFFKRLFFVLFWFLLLSLSIFYIEERYYDEWAVSFFVLFFILIFLSLKVIPSKKNAANLKQITEEYKLILKDEENVRSDAIKLAMQCPSCKIESNYWSFLEEYKCKKCGSELWSTTIKNYEDNYDKILKKRDKIYYFYQKITPSIKRKLKKYKMTGELY